MESTSFRPSSGVQDHMSNWTSNLIQAQDGCLQMVAHRVSMGRVQQEQVRAELDNHFIQEEEEEEEEEGNILTHMRLLSSEV